MTCWRNAIGPATFPGSGRQSPEVGTGGKGAHLGIPNVVDRVVRRAVLQILEPIFEPAFHASSHGFRPPCLR